MITNIVLGVMIICAGLRFFSRNPSMKLGMLV